ncbi:hypothetical protein CDD82_6228 [Ophiocordyceps australis]|uniref:DUF3824 domain-containing protein n=1 Tax=Ophiocordyceps australis TaxID=1399860 RepID=A0A2C5YYI7_9HYPO|nr:hypothetical protein CDD82_6228 [Ophiocordyceps australis]
MAGYDAYSERDYPRRYVRDDRAVDPRYAKVYPSRELVPRAREDSDLSIEEIHREFPPHTTRDIRRAHSAEPGYYQDYYYDSRRGYEGRRHGDYYDHDYPRHGSSSAYYDEGQRRSKHKTVSRQDKIIAAVAGAALLVGGKELYDRHEAKTEGLEVNRNPLSSAALAGFGALAGYQGAEFYSKQQAKRDQKATYILHGGRDGHIPEYYSDDEDQGIKEKKGHRNFLESALAATGLGAAVKSLAGAAMGDDRRSDIRSRRGDSPSGSHAGSRSASAGANKIQKAAIASLLAGATEAFRVSKEPGSWRGEKTKRILTAAAGAATVDAAQNDSHGRLGLAESVIGGLVGNRLINGSKKEIEEDRQTGRSRSRSRARSHSRGGGSRGGASGLAALATAGLGALGANKAFDSSASRSRRRDRDSETPSPNGRRRRSRSRSLVDKARNSLAKLGMGSSDDHGHGRDDDDFDDHGGGQGSSRYSDNMYQQDGNYARSRGDYEAHHGRRGYPSDSDLGDSDDDRRRARRIKGKQFVKGGLATVATIHAAHDMYQSWDKRRARLKAVQEGRISADEAKRRRAKDVVQDAASIGMAALGLSSVWKEMKEVKETTHECKQFKLEQARRHERREQRRHKQMQSRSRSLDPIRGSSSKLHGAGHGLGGDAELPARREARLDM